MEMTQTHTHWKKLTNPDYLGAYAFEPGEEKTATIDFVRREMVIGADGKKEECTVAHFREELKPLILNSTNCKTISNLLKTPYIEEWSGKKISMHTESVRAFGDVVDAVRVMKKLSAKAAQAPKCEECGKDIVGMSNFSAEQLAAASKQKYGKCLCVECGKKAKEAAEKKPAESDLAAQLMADAGE